jgi:hypothetical protein
MACALVSDGGSGTQVVTSRSAHRPTRREPADCDARGGVPGDHSPGEPADGNSQLPARLQLMSATAFQTRPGWWRCTPLPAADSVNYVLAGYHYSATQNNGQGAGRIR